MCLDPHKYIQFALLQSYTQRLFLHGKEVSIDWHCSVDHVQICLTPAVLCCQLYTVHMPYPDV